MFKVPKNLLRWIGTLTTTGLVIFLLFQVGWSEITDAIRHLSLSSVVLAFSGILFSRIFIGLRWWFLLPLKKEEGKSLGFWHAAQLHFTGLFANNFLPSTIGGDVVKWVGVKAWGISGTEGAAAVIMDRLIGVLGMALMVPYGGWMYLNTIGLVSTTAGWQVSMSVGGISFLQRIMKKIINILIQVRTVFSYYVHEPIILLKSFIATLLHMGGLFFAIWQIFRGLDQEVSFWIVGGLWSLVYFITLIPVSINGMGLQEMSITLIFSLVAGVSEESGLLMALIYRAMMMAASLVGGLFIGDLLVTAREHSKSGGLLKEVSVDINQTNIQMDGKE